MWRWPAWAAASLAAHAAVLAILFLQLSSLPAASVQGATVVSVEWVPMAPDRAEPVPAMHTQAQHAPAGRPERASMPNKPTMPAHPLADAGRHTMPSLPRTHRTEAKEASQVAVAPVHTPAPSPQEVARASRRNPDLVRRHLEHFKFYPESARRRGIGGDVDIGFRLIAGGHVAQVKIASSSGYALLDEAAEAIVARAVPFPVDTGRYRVRLRFWP